jgi:hypothetical protein
MPIKEGEYQFLTQEQYWGNVRGSIQQAHASDNGYEASCQERGVPFIPLVIEPVDAYLQYGTKIGFIASQIAIIFENDPNAKVSSSHYSINFKLS